MSNDIDMERFKETLIDTLENAKILSVDTEHEQEQFYSHSLDAMHYDIILERVEVIKIRLIPGASKREEVLSEEVIKSDQRVIEKVLNFKTKNSKRGSK